MTRISHARSSPRAEPSRVPQSSPPYPSSPQPSLQLSRRTLFRRTLVYGALGLAGVAAVSAELVPPSRPRLTVGAADTSDIVKWAPTVVVIWNNAALQAIRDLRPGPPMTARALAILHTCMYDAWTVYHPVALPTHPTRIPKMVNHPTSDRQTEANKTQAVSYAAYRALLDLFPAHASRFASLLSMLGYDPSDFSANTSMAAEIGNLCAQAVLSARRHDGANQAHGYVDTTGYPAAFGDYPAAPQPVNTPDAINDPNHWQPLRVADGQSGFVVQSYTGPHWGLVTPFALTSGAQFRLAAGPATTPVGARTVAEPRYVAQAQQILAYSVGLTDEQKVIAEYWKDGPHSEQPPGHWCLFAQFVSARDQHGLDDDVFLFFALTNALMDAGIAAWDTKRFYCSVRPITAIHYLYASHQVMAWAGSCLGTRPIPGRSWMPYQPVTIITPPFPEYVSGHSAFSAAGAEILKQFTGSDVFGYAVTIPAGSSAVEPGCTPSAPVRLSWAAFSQAADEAGLSRRYGGIHFEQGDLDGRRLGRQVGMQAWTKAQAYLTGTI
jgi:uncharacterized protein DUF6851/vanadium-dependent haloperoxidase-like protein